MTFAAILFVILGLSAVGYVLLGIRVTGSIRNTAAAPLGITFILMGVWVAGGSVELVASSWDIYSVAHLGHFFGTAFVPVTLLICFRRYTGSATSYAAISTMLIIPLCSIVIAATNASHELMWQRLTAVEAGAVFAGPEIWGPWFLFVHAPYTYTMVALCVLMLLWHSPSVAPADRRSMLLLAGLALIVMVASGAHDLGYGPARVSIVVLVLAAVLPIYAWMIVGKRINQNAPLTYEAVFQNMQDAAIVLDDQQRIVGLNYGAEALLNISEHDALRKTLESVFGEGVPEVYEALESGEPQKMLTNTGRFLHIQVTPISINKTAKRSGRVVMFRDVSDVERAQREVLNSEKLLRTLVNHSVNGIIRLHWVQDDAGNKALRCIFANSAAAKLLHVEGDDLDSCTAAELMVKVSTGLPAVEAGDLSRKFESVINNGVVLDTEACVEVGGKRHWLRLMAEPVGDDIAVTLIDSTDRKAEELRMEFMASSDPLTGVLNRRGFEREAAKRLTESADDATGALLFIDLNDFKQINDDHGHAAGDQLLTIAAQRLKSSLRTCDIIGRPGGDEFVALVPDVLPDVADILAQRLSVSLELPYMIGSKSLQCAASIGLALYPQNANTLTGLMRAADQAMYRAKARCRGNALGARRLQLLEKAV